MKERLGLEDMLSIMTILTILNILQKRNSFSLMKTGRGGDFFEPINFGSFFVLFIVLFIALFIIFVRRLFFI